MLVQGKDMPPPTKRQTFLFSATFPPEIQQLAKEFLTDYVWVGVGRVGSTVELIKQKIIRTTNDPNMKLRLLLEEIPKTTGRTLVFCHRKQTAANLAQILKNQYGIKADDIHGMIICIIRARWSHFLNFT